MTELVNQIPDVQADGGIDLLQTEDPLRHANLDADYRALYALLHQLDASDHWSGLSRILSPEDQILWLCSHHARQYTI